MNSIDSWLYLSQDYWRHLSASIDRANLFADHGISRLPIRHPSLSDFRPTSMRSHTVSQFSHIAVLTTCAVITASHSDQDMHVLLRRSKVEPDIFNKGTLSSHQKSTQQRSSQNYRESTLQVQFLHTWRFAQQFAQRMRAGKFEDFSETHHGYKDNMFPV